MLSKDKQKFGGTAQPFSKGPGFAIDSLSLVLLEYAFLAATGFQLENTFSPDWAVEAFLKLPHGMTVQH